MSNQDLCILCGMPILIPGEDGYLCSSRECGEEIVIFDKKKKNVIARHPAKGWVKRYSIPKLLKQKENRNVKKAKKEAQ